MRAVPFLVLALAGVGLAKRRQAREEPSVAWSIQALPTAKADSATKELLVGALVNVKAAGGAQQCDDFDQGTFVNRAVRLLSTWKTGAWAKEETHNVQVLERLVHYVDVMDLSDDADDAEYDPELRYPEQVVDHIREMKSTLKNDGILKGTNERLIEALNVIFDDICAGTGRVAEIPITLQELVDVVLRGISMESK